MTPDAVEARSRLRIMLMAPSPLVATSSNGRAVRLEADTALFSTGQRLEPDNLSNEALEDLQIQVSLRTRFDSMDGQDGITYISNVKYLCDSKIQTNNTCLFISVMRMYMNR